MKTIDELKEMVNLTITTNGTKQIAGADLRNALLEIIGTACAGGATRSRMYVPPSVFENGLPGLTEEQQAENAELYAAIKDAHDNGGAYPMVEMCANLNSENVVYSLNGDVICGQLEEEGFAVLVVNQNLGQMVLAEDGSVGGLDTSSYSLSPARMSTLNLAHNGKGNDKSAD